MPAAVESSEQAGWGARIDRLGQARPDLVLITPYTLYLLLLGLVQVVPPAWEALAIVVRGVVALWVVWLFRKHLPPWGKPHWPIAIVGGFAGALLWYQGQYFFDWIGLGGRLPLYPGEKVVTDPRDVLGAYKLFRATVALRIGVAVTTVALVEELFWRGFLLRVLINWRHFERVPLGKFTWFSFLAVSLLSTLEHPDNWAVSILCWFFFNALFYWTRSILCLVLVHGITNLVLYVHVVRVDDWAFW